MGVAQSQCNKYTTYDSQKEVGPLFFTDTGCRGNMWNPQVGTYNDLGAFNDNIDSIVIPPNYTVTGYSGPSQTGNTLTATGTVIEDLNLQDDASVRALIRTGAFLGTNDISSLRIEKTQTYEDMLANCCAGGGTTCLNFQPSTVSGPCPAFMADYCSRNPLSGPCGVYCAQNPAICSASVKKACLNVGTISAECVQWARTNPSTDSDDIMIKFCEQQPNSEYCACINSKVKTFNPACIDSACLRNGYQTRAMLATACPSIVNCSIVADLSSGGRLITNSITQNCSNTSGTSTVTASTEGATILGDYLWIFVLLVAIVILGAAAAYLFMDKNNVNIYARSD
jgi:hypothetical protein